MVGSDGEPGSSYPGAVAGAPARRLTTPGRHPMADRAPAPGRLALVQAFENTVDLERGEEELLSPEALAGWLARRGLLGPGERLSQADLERALAAREAVRALLLANGGAPVDPEAADALDRLGAAARLRVRFD